MAEQFLRVGGTDGQFARSFRTNRDGELITTSPFEQQTIFEGSVDPGEKLEILQEINVPFDVQSIGVFVRKPAVIETNLYIRQSNSTTSGSAKLLDEQFNNKGLDHTVVVPVKGNRVRIHLENLDKVSRNFYVWLVYYRQPQIAIGKSVEESKTREVKEFEIQLNDTTETTIPLDIQKYKSVNLMVQQAYRTEVGLRLTYNGLLVAPFINDGWEQSVIGSDLDISLSRKQNGLYLLNTHPAYHFLNNLKLDKIEIRLRAHETPQNLPDEFVKIILVGEVK